MLFNSPEFLVFFLVVTLLYYLLPFKFRWFHLLIASCYFYMQFVPIYILILFGTIVIDYFAGILIERSEDNEKRQRLFLIMSLVANIGVLAVFKYYNFFVENVNRAGASLPFLKILLPIGLSFHTFQAMSYTFEVYRGNQKAERHFGIYSLYVMFYPQLVAGPIERPQNVLPQLKTNHPFRWENIASGLRLMLWGLFKKVVVADRLSNYVDIVYGQPNTYPHFLNVLIAFIFFSFQVYCDFSGYSDMALGSAKTMGIDLMVNFNRPFSSKSISEFWRRWHISLSTWFNEYLFTPLVATWRYWGKWGIILGVFITFALSGLWHGAAWTFVAFGVIHGIGLIYEILTKNIRARVISRLPAFIATPLCILLTYSFVVVSVVFFRANSMHEAFGMLRNLVTLNRSVPFAPIVRSKTLEFGIVSFIFAFASMGFTLLFEKFTSPRLEEFNRKPWADALVSALILTLIIVFGVFQNKSFIYFQF